MVTVGSGDVWLRLGALTGSSQVDLIEPLLLAEIHTAHIDRDLDRAASSTVALGLHLQKSGHLRAAARNLRTVSEAPGTSLGTRFDADFYLAKISTQRGQHAAALHGYARLEGRLRSGESSLAGRTLTARYQTLVWREAFSRLMLGDNHIARTMFDIHYELATPNSNQVAINRIYGGVVPSLLDGDARQVRFLEEAVEATRAYESVDITARFTHPAVALVQRDLLGVVKGLARGDRPAAYRSLWRAGFSLRACRATPAAEGIAELNTILDALLPETRPVLAACVQGGIAMSNVMLRAAAGDSLSYAFASALDELAGAGDASAGPATTTDPSDSTEDTHRPADLGGTPSSPTIFADRADRTRKDR